MVSEDRARANAAIAFQTLKRVLIEVGWNPVETDVEGELKVDFSQDNPHVDYLAARIRFGSERLVLAFNLKGRAEDEARQEAMVFVTKANDGLVVGCIELNLDSGKAKVRHSIDFTESTLSAALVRNAIQSSMDAVEAYAVGLAAVMRGEVKADDAIKAIEG